MEQMLGNGIQLVKTNENYNFSGQTVSYRNEIKFSFQRNNYDFTLCDYAQPIDFFDVSTLQFRTSKSSVTLYVEDIFGNILATLTGDNVGVYNQENVFNFSIDWDLIIGQKENAIIKITDGTDYFVSERLRQIEKEKRIKIRYRQLVNHLNIGYFFSSENQDYEFFHIFYFEAEITDYKNLNEKEIFKDSNQFLINLTSEQRLSFVLSSWQVPFYLHQKINIISFLDEIYLSEIKNNTEYEGRIFLAPDETPQEERIDLTNLYQSKTRFVVENSLRLVGAAQVTPIPKKLPKLTVFNLGSKTSYVLVEYDSEFVYVAPESQREFEILENTNIKLTRAIVNPTTGVLDSARFNINVNEYAFPSRMLSAEINGVSDSGTINPTIPDESSTAKLREHLLVKSSSSEKVEFRFEEQLPLYDFNFEDAKCLGGVNIGEEVISLVDRMGIIPTITQTTSSLRGVRRNGYLELNSGFYGSEYPTAFDTPGGDIDTRRPTTFFVAKPRRLGASPVTFVTAREKTGGYQYYVEEHGYRGNFLYQNYGYLFSNDFSPPQPNNYTSTFLGTIHLCIFRPYGSNSYFRIGGTWHAKANQWSHSFSPTRGLSFGNNVYSSPSNLDIDYYRMIGFSYNKNLLSSEINILSQKLIDKYNII